MTVAESVITIAAVVAGTMLTRFIPFIVFQSGKKIPDTVKYLGGVLPYAVMGLLVVYSLKDVSLFSGSHGIPEALALILICVLHVWKRNMLLSIGAGTVLYMFLVQAVF